MLSINAMILKKLFPYSLFGRFLLIIVLPSIFIQSITIYIFYNEHWDSVSKHMSLSLASDISYIVKQYKSTNSIDDQGKLIQFANDSLYLKVKLDENKPTTLEDNNHNKIIQKLSNNLNSKLTDKFYISDTGDKNLMIYVILKNETLIFDVPIKRINSPSTYIFTTWVIVTSIFFVLLSIMFMRNQIRSIVNISIAAEKYSTNRDYAGFKPSGALEVRKVAKSFILMKNSLKRHIEQRTLFLAGVSHDLKTPLTRIKLHLGILEESDDIEEIKRDVEEMEKMIDGYLQFAKGNEKQVANIIDTADLLKTTISAYKNNHLNISLNIKSVTNINISPNSLKRVLNNLIDNAIRYADNIEINVELSKKYLIINIEDDGAGIAKDKREEVFRPFYRIDESRHLDSANTGLGLSIARDIVTSCNGKIELGDSQMGGLKVTLKLPA